MAAITLLEKSFAVKEVGLRLLLSPMASTIVVRTACVAVGVGFPVYSTFKAIEQKDSQEQEQWLVYWAVYGCFSVSEVFSDKLLSWFPYYYHAKLVVLIWLQLPISNGARHCFMNYLRPFFLKHQTKLDWVVDGARNEITKVLLSHKQEIQFVQNGFHKLLTPADETNKDSELSTPEGNPSHLVTRRTLSAPNSTVLEESSTSGPPSENVARDDDISEGDSPRDGGN